MSDRATTGRDTAGRDSVPRGGSPTEPNSRPSPAATRRPGSEPAPSPERRLTQIAGAVGMLVLLFGGQLLQFFFDRPRPRRDPNEPPVQVAPERMVPEQEEAERFVPDAPPGEGDPAELAPPGLLEPIEEAEPTPEGEQEPAADRLQNSP